MENNLKLGHEDLKVYTRGEPIPLRTKTVQVSEVLTTLHEYETKVATPILSESLAIACYKMC